MKELIISGEDSYIEMLKSHLEKEHPKTKGKMWIKGYQEKGFSSNFKDNFKKSLSPINDIMKKLDDDLKDSMKSF